MGKATSSYQQRLFSDEQLGLRSHDDIVRWVDQRTKSGGGTLLQALELPHVDEPDGRCRAWGPNYIDFEGFDHLTDRSVPHMIRSLLDTHKPKYPSPPEVEISRPVWEKIIAGPRGGVIGAIDLAFSIKVFRPVLSIKTATELPMSRESLLTRLDELFGPHSSGIWVNGKFALATDLAWKSCAFEPSGLLAVIRHQTGVIAIEELGWEQHGWANETHFVYVEAKTDIKSAGELLRQMNLYRAHAPTKGNKFLVVAPRDKVTPEVEEILKEQGIFFLAFQSN